MQYNLITSWERFVDFHPPFRSLTAGVELFPPVSSLENSSLSVQRISLYPGRQAALALGNKKDAPRVVISVRGSHFGILPRGLKEPTRHFKVWIFLFHVFSLRASVKNSRKLFINPFDAALRSCSALLISTLIKKVVINVASPPLDSSFTSRNKTDKIYQRRSCMRCTREERGRKRVICTKCKVECIKTQLTRCRLC